MAHAREAQPTVSTTILSRVFNINCWEQLIILCKTRCFLMFFSRVFEGHRGGGCGQRALSYTPPNVLKAFKARIRCFKRFKTFERSHMTLLEHFYNFSFFSKIFDFLDFFLSHGHQALAVRESPKGDDQTGKTAETDICF